MIPKIIHYCWFGERPLSDDAKTYISTWQKYCPDFDIKEWNEKNFDPNINQYCSEAYNAKQWAFVSDYVRIKVLYEFGGVYLDTDVEMVKSIEPLLKYRGFCGFESESQVQTGVLGCCKNNEWIKKILESYNASKFLKSDGSYDLTTNVSRITRLTQNEYAISLNNTKQLFGENMILLPFDFLCAQHFKTGIIQRTENTFTIHHFAGTWLAKEEATYLQKTRRYYNKYPSILNRQMADFLIKTLVAYQTGGIKLLTRKIEKKIFSKNDNN